MPPNKLPHYLRTYRKRASLSEKEMAFLLGSKSAAQVSRYERYVRLPNLEKIFAYQVIFGIPPYHLFAGIIQKVEQNVQRRAQLLIAKLEKESQSRKTKRKLEFLKGLVSKISSTTPENI